MLEVVEWDELDDISCHVLPVGAGVESLVIAIKRLHRLKISVTNTNDDDGERVLRATNNLIDCLVHVADDSISDNGQNVELLVHLSHTVGLHEIVDFINDLSEVSRSIEIALLNGVLVVCDNLLNAIDTWVENVTVQGETVATTVGIGWNSSSKAIQVYLLVAVVELEDVANALNRLQVLIALHVEVVK